MPSRASLLGQLFSDIMVRAVNCHTGALGSNPGGPNDFHLAWNYFTGGSGNSVAPESQGGGTLIFPAYVGSDPA